MSAPPCPNPAQPPLVSALITAHDQERFLAAALDSALGQDYPPERLEVVVVDDGSTDATPEILADWSTRHPSRLRVVRQDNLGYPAATARAVAEARGELLALLDGDDAWPADKVRRQVELLLERPEVGLVYGDMVVVDAEDKVVQESWLEGDDPPEGRCAARLLTGNPVTSSSVVLRAALAREALPFPPGIAYADWWFAMWIAQRGEIAYLPEPRTRYRFHGGNMALGVAGAARQRALVRTLAFQRWFLRRAEPGAATPREAGAAWSAFEQFAREAIAFGGTPFASPFPIDDDDRRRSRDEVSAGRALLAAGSHEEALAAFLRAAAEDPWYEGARDGLSDALAAAVRGGRAEAALAA